MVKIPRQWFPSACLSTVNLQDEADRLEGLQEMQFSWAAALSPSWMCSLFWFQVEPPNIAANAILTNEPKRQPWSYNDKVVAAETSDLIKLWGTLKIHRLVFSPQSSLQRCTSCDWQTNKPDETKMKKSSRSNRSNLLWPACIFLFSFWGKVWNTTSCDLRGGGLQALRKHWLTLLFY